MRILIVEDDAPLAQGLAFHLKHAGFAADVCEDGLGGLEAASQGQYELILLDRMLPGLDGVQLLRRLRGRRITTPVLMITAMANIGDRVEGLDAGADDYLVKPFAVEELLARVRALGRRAPQLSEPERLQYGKITLNADRGFMQHENGASAPLASGRPPCSPSSCAIPGRCCPAGCCYPAFGATRRWRAATWTITSISCASAWARWGRT